MNKGKCSISEGKKPGSINGKRYNGPCVVVVVVVIKGNKKSLLSLGAILISAQLKDNI